MMKQYNQQQKAQENSRYGEAVSELAEIFAEMVHNHDTFGESWRNIKLGVKAFDIMRSLPDVLPGEYETMAEKAGLLDQMLDRMDETVTPRFCISVREEIARIDPQNEGNREELQMLRDYIDLSLPMEEFCRRYGRHLKFDPVERTAEYEAVIADVEAETAEELKECLRGMGFCFGYWSAKTAILARYGIEWRSPSVMNPHVIFD